MLTPIPPSDCARAREAASARVDGELSERERAELEAHLDGCEECRTYAAEVGELAGRLRAAALEPVAVPLYVPSRRRPLVHAQVAAAAILAVAAIGSSFAIGQMLGSRGSHPSATVGTTVSLAKSQLRPQLVGVVRRLRPVRMPAAAVIPV
jgi:predicted anti-sigma-YlaC factor YlaD